MVIRFLLGFMESFKYRIVSSNRGDLNAFSFCTLLIHFYCLILGMTLSTMVNKNRAGKTAWNEFYFQNSFLVIFLVSQFPYWSLEFPLSVTDYYIWCGNLSWSWIHFLSHSSAFESSIWSLIHLKSRIWNLSQTFQPLYLGVCEHGMVGCIVFFTLHHCVLCICRDGYDF